jgi:hypothetical protein
MTRSSADEPDRSGCLADLLFYAPLGLLWERDQVLERLVKRGRSQSQLAKLAAQMAAQRGPEQVEAQVTQALESLARAAAGPISRVLIEAGVAFGVPGAARPSPQGPADRAEQPASEQPMSEQPASEQPVSERGMPADYETLSARELLPRLTGLDPVTLIALRDRELAGRGRKTVLSRIEQLLESS